MFMGPNDTMFNGILINMYTNVMPCNYCEGKGVVRVRNTITIRVRVRI